MLLIFYLTYGRDAQDLLRTRTHTHTWVLVVFLIFWQMHITVLLVSFRARRWKEGCLDLSCISAVVHISSLGCLVNCMHPKNAVNWVSFLFAGSEAGKKDVKCRVFFRAEQVMVAVDTRALSFCCLG